MKTADAVWRRHKAEAVAPPDLTIGIASSMTADPIAPHLGAWLLENGFINPQITLGAFNQLPQACRDPELFFGMVPDVIVLLWRLDDIFPDLLTSPADLSAAVADLAASVRTLREKFSGTIIVSTPPYPTSPAFNLRALDQALVGGAMHARIVAEWITYMNDSDRIRLLDLNGLLMKVGIDRAYDARKWFLYRQPWSEIFWDAIGQQLGRSIRAQTRSARKCIVLDADNTLWGGVIGEDGIEGIALGDDFPGSPYREFQKYLLHLQSRGVLLAIASKNNPDDFYQVIDSHDAMALRRENIALFQIHWNSKVDSLRRIAEKLNIGLDAIVFVDDSAKEIAEVQERLPDVACIMVPEEIANLPALLAETDFFDQAEITAEDRQRTNMIRIDQARQDTRQAMSEEDFKAALGLQMTVFRAGRQHLARITQLVNKTNQFNLTTIRRTSAEIDAMTRSPCHLVLGMDLKDNYGDYGLVGVAILEKTEAACLIDTLLMSCRVLGRDAETAFLAQLLEGARTLGSTVIEGRYVATAKNGMVADFYPRHGFTPGDTGKWTASCRERLASPSAITVKNVIMIGI